MCCRGLTIHVLDVAALGQAHGLPACHPEDRFAVDPQNGIVYLNDTSHHHQHHLVHHKFGTHAAPWCVTQVMLSEHAVVVLIAFAAISHKYDVQTSIAVCVTDSGISLSFLCSVSFSTSESASYSYR